MTCEPCVDGLTMHLIIIADKVDHAVACSLTAGSRPTPAS